ncbi:hypothetical protein RHMOL_Rhmol01G0213700 [Rhododendron molle]|uniref:Uncharacterized protein n=1 Tax=Rhododendron molle TaxID=49168 RepID=A0ACC0Q6L6_RHOML|nr:hypothetical protein RHMOL_Rhmol01G0213700 [Rhododendron molle]
MPLVCTKCRVFGHATSRCPRTISRKQTQDRGLLKEEWQSVTKGTSVSNLGGSVALDAVTTPVVAVVDTSTPKVIEEDLVESVSEGEELNVNLDNSLVVHKDIGVLSGSVEVESVIPPIDPDPATSGLVPSHPVPLVKPVPPDDKAEAVTGEAYSQISKDLKPHNNKGSGKNNNKKWSSSSKRRHK